MGVLFFLIVVTWCRSRSGPTSRCCAASARDPVARRPAGEPARPRPAARRRPGRRLARPHLDGAHTARTGGAVKALAHWLTTGLPLVIAAPRARRCSLTSICRRSAAVALTLLAGTPALTLHRSGRRRAFGHAPARRPAACRAGAAAHDPGADLRGRGIQRRDRRAAAFGDAVHDPVRALTLTNARDRAVAAAAAGASARRMNVQPVCGYKSSGSTLRSRACAPLKKHLWP